MPHYPCVAWVDGVFSVSLPTLLGTPSICAFILLMSTNNYYNFGTISNDHSKHVTVNVPAGANVADIVRAVMAEDITPSEDSSNYSDCQSDIPSSPASDNRPEDILSIPKEGKYTKVREYIKERCRFDAEFKTFVKERSLRDLCTRLTKEFGWFVDEHSLGSNLNRHRKD